MHKNYTTTHLYIYTQQLLDSCCNFFSDLIVVKVDWMADLLNYTAAKDLFYAPRWKVRAHSQKPMHQYYLT